MILFFRSDRRPEEP